MEPIYDGSKKLELPNKSIVLIGFMGAGKSVVGRVLSKTLSLDFYDADEVVEAKEGMTIPDIFSAFGEKYFRGVESEVIRDLLGQKIGIISTGGGAVTNQGLLDLMLDNAIVIHLDASMATLYDRLKDMDDDRPMLRHNDLKGRISELYAQRKPLYERAHYSVDTNNKSIREVTEEIINFLGEA